MCGAETCVLLQCVYSNFGANLRRLAAPLPVAELGLPATRVANRMQGLFLVRHCRAAPWTCSNIGREKDGPTTGCCDESDFFCNLGDRGMSSSFLFVRTLTLPAAATKHCTLGDLDPFEHLQRPRPLRLPAGTAREAFWRTPRSHYKIQTMEKSPISQDQSKAHPAPGRGSRS